MKVASRLMSEHHDVYFQTHLSENPKEVEFTLELFPECKSYLDVYDSFGLLGQRSIFGHCIHLQDEDFKRVAETGSVLCPNPPSNFFLGSGLFKFENAKSRNVRVALGTDFGAGNTLSMLSSMENAYKMAQLQGYSLSPWEAFYYATLRRKRFRLTTALAISYRAKKLTLWSLIKRRLHSSSGEWSMRKHPPT